MGKFFLIFLLLLIILAGAGVLVLGMFPPAPRTQQISHTIPTDKLPVH